LHFQFGNLALILNIETSTTNCSVTLAENGKELVSCAINDGYKHSERLMTFVNQVFVESQKKFSDLDAIAISEGPGSYTGLRIGVSAAKGISYALDKPLIAINSLEIMASAVCLNHPGYDLFIPMIDARRMEVYTAVYSNDLVVVDRLSAMIIDENAFRDIAETEKVIYFGDGADKCEHIFNARKNFNLLKAIMPTSLDMASLSFKKYQMNIFESVAYFEPNYLKDFHTNNK
jgi:tRNA threonylcarbamoyladenosine biosynthesis protein TsaB